MAKRKRSRKQFYVSRAIQGRLMTRMVVYWLLYHVFQWHALFLSEGLIGINGPKPVTTLYVEFFWNNLPLFAVGTAILPIIMWDMLKMSHRVAGPFVRFERALRAMARGEKVDKIKLRKTDFVDEFLAVFNAYVAIHNQEVGHRPKRPSHEIEELILEELENDRKPSAARTEGQSTRPSKNDQRDRQATSV